MYYDQDNYISPEEADILHKIKHDQFVVLGLQYLNKKELEILCNLAKTGMIKQVEEIPVKYILTDRGEDYIKLLKLVE